MASTKRFLQTNTVQAKNKSKKDCADDVLLKKAICCLEKVGEKKKDDDDELFGLHVASELRHMESEQWKRWAKWQIQNILFNAQSKFDTQSAWSMNNPSMVPTQPYTGPVSPDRQSSSSCMSSWSS